MNPLRKIDRRTRDFILFIFDLIKFIPLKLVEPSVSSTVANQFTKEILLIKLDEIGDYFLFRNFLAYIKQSELFKDFKVTICGNSVWKNLAENLDVNFVDEFIWLNKGEFSTNLLYRYKFLKMISSRNPIISINCSYSRSFYLDDTVIYSIKSKRKIGFNTDLSNSYRWQIRKSDYYYNELINSEKERFDFYKNKILFTKVLQMHLPIERPEIKLESIQSNLNIDTNYVMFFVGGRLNYKRWKLNNFVKLGEYLIQNYKLKIALIGSISEQKINEKFISNIKMHEQVINLTGKTTFVELLKLLKDTKLLISNDTGIVHAAASLNVPTVVLANGTHFGRFLL